MAASSNNKPVFDVSKPGKSAPSATSRPVIVNHGPMMKDPMVSDPDDTDKKDDKPTAATSESRKIIAPPSDLEKEEPASEDTPATESEDSKADKKKSAEQAVVDAVVDQAGKKKKSQPTEEELAKQIEVEKLIESKKYFVPIGEVTRRRNARRLMIGLVAFVLIGLVGSYLAVDAKLLDIGVDLPFNIIP